MLDRRSFARRPALLALAAATAMSLTVPAASATATPPAPRAAAVERPAEGTPYTNPVSASFADTYADPSVIRGKDGWWYSVGTSDPLREGEGVFHRIPISRSRDLVSWTYLGDAFSDATLPSWATADAGIWAPDLRYVDGEYRMYYVVTSTTVTPEANDNAIGMATAPTPAGPWTDSGAPVVEPRRGAGAADDFLWTFDPTAVTDTDGSQWLFYGSYYGGVFATRMTADGRRTAGAATQVAIDNKFEGAYVVRRGGYWYLFASTANCCAGPTTGYSVQVGRSRSLTGPYVDREGTPLTASRAGGTPVLTQNGNQWVGAGHNAVVTDLAGQDWIAYHAIDRADPYLDGTSGVNERPMLIDRLDWVDGWPAVRAGLGPSSGPQPGPVAQRTGAASFDAGIDRSLRTLGRWTTATDAQAGRHAVAASTAALVTRGTVVGDVRVEADLRGGAAASLVAGRGVLFTVDPRRGTARLTAGGRSTVTPLPRGFVPRAWHSAVLELRDGRATAELSNARLGDPLARLSLPLRRFDAGPGPAGVLAHAAGVRVDNLSARPAAVLVTRLAPDAVPSRLDADDSDEFGAATLGAGWSWVRPDPAATVSGGALRWPVQAADLTGAGNDAGVLLRSVGAGEWTAETKVTIDLGVEEIRNFQQAGIIAYVDDDQFARLSHVAIFNTRQTEFGKEMPYAGGLAYGGTIIGPPAETTWLRLTHRVDPDNGEHELRGWSSRDGRSWVKGGVWTLPAGADVRVGLVAHGLRDGAPATAAFDYLRIYR